MLLKPTQIRQVLKESASSNPEGIKGILEAEGLGPEEVVAQLGTVMRGAENNNIRLKAIDTALKLSGLMKNDNGVQAPIVNIIINDSEYSQSVNPILVPR